MIIYHGSSHIIEKPIYGAGNRYNDYGLGFYCTEHLELAEEWTVTEEQNGYANRYSLDTEQLRICHLTLPDYTILHWLALLVDNRTFNVGTAVAKAGKEYLHDHFLPDISQYDIVIGCRADDSYFSFAKAFVNNEISLKQLSMAMYLGDLGEQVVLKSRKAFELIEFDDAVPASFEEFYPQKKKRDDNARSRYREEVMRDDISGLYMRDIIREEVGPDDPRIR